MNFKELFKSNETIKKIVLWMLRPEFRPRPRLWVKILLNPFIHKKAKGAMVSNNTRMDVFPYNKFIMGQYSTIEDFSCINNAVGDVVIGEKSRVGLSNTIIGPVRIGDNVNMAQNIVVSGLNHGYEDVSIPPREQDCSMDQIVIEDNCWIGANVVITAGVKLAKHTVVAAGSVVTKSFPGYSILAGNPARMIKYYNHKACSWIKNVDHKKSAA